MPIAFSYRRFSTPEQAKGDSIRRQQAEYDAICARKNWTPAPATYFDEGKSAFKGDDQKALKAFIRLASSGQIPKGSILVIESLDRLTRMGPRKAVRLLEQILENGVDVATTTPERHYSDETLDKGMEGTMQLLEIMMIAQRAREESETKSKRVTAAAFNRHKRAKAGDGIMTSRSPWWLRRVGDKWQLIPERVAVVRRIFKMAIEQGLGQRAIAKRLNVDGIEPPKGRAWGWAYTRLILTDSRVTGTFISKLGNIPEYFPEVISKADFMRVQVLTKKRLRFKGATSAKIANLFTGLAFDEESGSTMVYVRKASSKPARWIPSIYETKGKAAGNAVSFNYNIFESVFLNFTKELRLDQVADDNTTGREISSDIQLELDQLDLQIDSLKASLIANSSALPIPEIVEAMGQLHSKRLALNAKLEQASMPTANAALEQTQSVLERLEQAKGPELVELRGQLRQSIRNLVSRINVRIARKGYWTKMFATVHFSNGQFRMIGIFTYRGVLDSVFTHHNELKDMNDKMDLEVFAATPE